MSLLFLCMHLNFWHLKTVFWEGVHRLHQTAEEHKKVEGSWVRKLATPGRCARRLRTLPTDTSRFCRAKRAGSYRRRASCLPKDMWQVWRASLACGNLNLRRVEWFLQQAGIPPALGAPPAQNLHQALPFLLIQAQNHSFHWLSTLKLAEHSGMQSLCWQPCRSQHKASMRWEAGGQLSRGSPEEWADWELLSEDQCLSPRCSGIASGKHWPPRVGGGVGSTRNSMSLMSVCPCSSRCWVRDLEESWRMLATLWSQLHFTYFISFHF